MEWAVWTGIAIFVVTIAGMLIMRNRPVRDANGVPVDEFGRPINTNVKLSNDSVIVLNALHASAEYLSGYDLRRYVDHLSRQEFYALIADLEHRELIKSKIELVGAHNVRRYFLTDYGVDIFN